MITVAEALMKMTAEDESAAKALEARIDRALMKFDGGPILVDCPNFSQKVRNKITDMYRQAGWTVELTHGDQQDPGP